VALALTGALLGSVCQTLVPLIARQIIDGVIVRRDSPLWPWLALLVVVAVARFGFTYLRRYRGGRVGLEVQYDLRNAMHDHLQTMDLDNLDRMPTGQLVARELRFHARARSAQLHADHERQRTTHGAVARGHVLSVTVAGHR
jgi:ATP-binding cassette subfamily B protein